MQEDWRAIEASRETEYIRKIEENLRKIYILDEYKKVVDEVKDRIETDLKEKYKDIKFYEDTMLISCYIKDYLFEISLEDKLIYISFYKNKRNKGSTVVETFEGIFNYIDDIIKK